MQDYEPNVDAILQLYAQLEDDIIRSMVRRIMKMGYVSDATRYEAEVLQTAGLLYDDILMLIAQRTDATTAQVRALFEDAGVKTVAIDNETYQSAGAAPIDIRQDEGMKQLLEEGYRKTLGTMRNLTSTTAIQSQQAFISACDRAHMQVASGAFSYQEAIRQAVLQFGAGAKVMYPSGHIDKMDVAIRRAVLTGVGQTAAAVAVEHAKQAGRHLMEITAHSGARPEHARWQGQLVSLTGEDVGKIIDGMRVYSLKEIGYGEGDGFKGWNCRHNWHPYYPGLSTPNYTKEQLQELDARSIEWDGEMYTEYEISQMQRAGERKVRSLKRKTIAAEEAVKNAPDAKTKAAAEKEYTGQAVKLKEAEKQLAAFCKATGQRRDRFREQVVGFGRSVSQRAVHANKKAQKMTANWLTSVDKDGKIDIEIFKTSPANGNVNTTIEQKQQRKHQTSPDWKNQVKQAMRSGGKQTPKSRLHKSVDPQEIVDKYGGTGKLDAKKNNQCVEEYVTLPFEVGVTYDRNLGKYVPTHRVQIKYTKNGTHVFPVKEGGRKQ